MKNNFLIIIKIVAIICVLAGVWWGVSTFIFNDSKDTSHMVSVGNVYERVTVAGRAKSATEVSLSFELSAKVQKVMVSDGDKVEQGTVIASVDPKKWEEALAKANSNLKIVTRQLEELKMGTRKEDVAVSTAELTKAKLVEQSSLRDLVNSIKASYVMADDVFYNKTNQFFENPKSESSFLLSSLLSNNYENSQLDASIRRQRGELWNKLLKWKVNVDSLSTETFSNASYEETLEILNEMRTYLNLLSTAINNSNVSSRYPQETIDDYKEDVSVSRASISSSISIVTTNDAEYKDQEALVAVIQKQVDLKESGTLEEVLKAQEERVALARSEVRDAEADLLRTKLVTPIKGVVSGLDIKPGEVVAVGDLIAKVIPEGLFEIEADVPEVYVGRVVPGQSAKAVFEAFPDDSFDGSVVKIDAGPTDIDGVVNYKTTLDFKLGNSPLRAGMTATILMTIAEKEGVLAVPTHFIKKDDEGQYVYVRNGGSVEKRIVVTGISGDNGMTEIVSGLTTDEVITNNSLR